MSDDARPEIDLDVPDPDALRMGAALADLLQTEGWRVLVELQERAANEISRSFIRNEGMTKDYARGYLRATEDVEHRVKQIVARGREAQATAQEDSHVVFGNSRLGSGSLAGE